VIGSLGIILDAVERSITTPKDGFQHLDKFEMGSGRFGSELDMVREELRSIRST